jgi:hypothetical protein
MLSPLDDYPYHQIAEPLNVVGTSDRNFYDRYYFNLFQPRRDLFVTAGLGQYPNLGVTDAFMAATTPDRQYVVRASRELGTDRRDTSVGPISVEVIEGLHVLRVRVARHGGSLELDVTWRPSIPAFLEARHVNRRGARVTTDTSRFAQTGFWSGTMRLGDEHLELRDGEWLGGRDRSWGIRPVGEPEPIVRHAGEGAAGFLWLYCTMQFERSTIVCILQEDRLGRRSLEQAVRVYADPERPPDDLGRIDHELHFVNGTRRIARARLTFTTLDAPPLVVDAVPFGASYLSLGTGYGHEDDWRHGMYQGPSKVEHHEYDLTDAGTAHRTRGLVDNVATFETPTEVGYGLLENAVLGANERYGFGVR